jgi:hypothetical protein
MKLLRRAPWLLVLTLAGCASGLTLAPETVIDGYTIGTTHQDCPISNPECAKILSLVRTRGLASPAGRAQIADCSFSKQECIKFTGSPQGEGFSKDGMGEIVGLAEDAMLAEHNGLDPATIVGFQLYSESLTPYIAADGHWLAHRTGGYNIVVFVFADGSAHAAGVGCSVGQCWAHR